jgi:hypothetical protein
MSNLRARIKEHAAKFDLPDLHVETLPYSDLEDLAFLCITLLPQFVDEEFSFDDLFVFLQRLDDYLPLDCEKDEASCILSFFSDPNGKEPRRKISPHAVKAYQIFRRFYPLKTKKPFEDPQSLTDLRETFMEMEHYLRWKQKEPALSAADKDLQIKFGFEKKSWYFLIYLVFYQ